MAQQTNSFGFLQGSGSGGGGTDENLGNTDLTQDSGTRNFDVGSSQTLNIHTDGNTSKIGLKIDSDNQEVFIGNSDMNVIVSTGTPLTTNSTIEFKNGTSAPAVRFFEASGSGNNYVELTCGALGSNKTITMPDETGTMALLEARQTFTDRNTINAREFAVTSSTDGDVIGDIVFFGTTSVIVGRFYYWDGSGWAATDASAAATSTGMLAVSCGTGAANSVGMCIRGFITLSIDSGTNGDILYLSETAQQATSTAPTTSGAIVRIIGYCMDDSNGQIFFNPDNSFVELA